MKEEYDDQISIHPLDVSDTNSRRNFYNFLSTKTDKLDLLINNAGVISGNEEFCKPFGELDQDDLCKTLLINSVSPLMIAEMVFPLLKKGEIPVIVNITSDNGSIARKNQKGKFGYSASKAALNMMTKILSIDLNEFNMIVISLHPGWVKTPMTQGEEAPLNPSESINGMIKIIDSLEMSDTGMFLDWKGNEIPW